MVSCLLFVDLVGVVRCVSFVVCFLLFVVGCLRLSCVDVCRCVLFICICCLLRATCCGFVVVVCCTLFC